ncbi:hypothetical protein FIBSPDRAFT_1047937 [Athelia psychrophila]|uniref:Small ribosomal subunit protein uS15 N-terminal domain-containing protein n=1 Tax=Athelia psychrophila TaxID=1759441 RepID=A0A166EFF2_9AGAM|nr:hypothetical protein FIBSPDRAFT_1047937 [Fibularhizoctonia sp. CBS 109695]
MGRAHASGKGICLPYRRGPGLKPPADAVEHIIKLARKGLTPTAIGVTLCDSHGIPQVRFVTGNKLKILRVLKSNDASPPQSSCADCAFFFPSLCCSFVLPPSFTDTFLFGGRIGTAHPRGPLVPRQKGGRCAQEPRGQPQGQGLQVPPHLIESRIHRLARYYKTKQKIAPAFKYDSATASTLIA